MITTTILIVMMIMTTMRIMIMIMVLKFRKLGWCAINIKNESWGCIITSIASPLWVWIPLWGHQPTFIHSFTQEEKTPKNIGHNRDGPFWKKSLKGLKKWRKLRMGGWIVRKDGLMDFCFHETNVKPSNPLKSRCRFYLESVWMWVDVRGCEWMWGYVSGCEWMWVDVSGCEGMWGDGRLLPMLTLARRFSLVLQER